MWSQKGNGANLDWTFVFINDQVYPEYTKIDFNTCPTIRRFNYQKSIPVTLLLYLVMILFSE